MKFALFVRCKEVKAFDGAILTVEGQWARVCVEPEGWVEATGSKLARGDELSASTPIGDAKLFDSHAEATAFAERWKGHPWYVVPNGQYRVVEVRAVYKQVLDRYDIVGVK